MIPVNEPLITQTSKDIVRRALDEGWISSSGPYLEQFESDFARYLGVSHAVAVSSGTAALHLSLLSLGVGPGDEVIVPSFTMAATWMAVLYTGAKPVFVDVDNEIYTLDPTLIESAITSRTKAILPVHIYGHPAQMDPILEIAREHGLAVVEDAAESLGARYKGSHTGTLGDLGIFSFYANKLVTTGEGGMVVTADATLAESLRSLRNLGHSPAKRFVHDRLGYNYRMGSLQAALGIGQLQSVEEFLVKKISMAREYEKGLQHIQGLTLPTTASWATHSHWMYTVLVDETGYGISRDQLRSQLETDGIETRDFFYPPHSHPVLQGQSLQESYPVSERLSQQGLYLPSGLSLTSAQIQTVCETINKYANR